jgi:hypothetical protein
VTKMRAIRQLSSMVRRLLAERVNSTALMDEAHELLVEISREFLEEKRS